MALFLQQRTLHPELIQDHRGPGSLLLTPRLDSQATFAKLIADIGVEGDIRYAQLTRLLENGAPVSTAVTAQHVQAFGLISELKQCRTLRGSQHTLRFSCMASQGF